jgi:hypothetical protein
MHKARFAIHTSRTSRSCAIVFAYLTILSSISFAQDDFVSRWFYRVDATSAEQPYWPPPATTVTPLLVEPVMYDFSREEMPNGTETVNDGYGRGLYLTPADPLQVNIFPPPDPEKTGTQTAAAPASTAQTASAEANSCTPADATFWQRFLAHTCEMAEIQPVSTTPFVLPDPRLVQYARFAVSHQYTPAGTETVNYGSGHGGGIILFERFQLDFAPPSYIEHNSTAKDGIGDATLLVKYRVASSGPEHHNFVVTADLAKSWATGTHSNGARTGIFTPIVAVSKGFGNKNYLLASLSGTLPTGKINTQGRTIVWNTGYQGHPVSWFWIDVEDNATFFKGGPNDGKMQNFLTPGFFLVLKRKSWPRTHWFIAAGEGMQIATSSYHAYNHNLISDFRFVF